MYIVTYKYHSNVLHSCIARVVGGGNTLLSNTLHKYHPFPEKSGALTSQLSVPSDQRLHRQRLTAARENRPHSSQCSVLSDQRLRR